MQIRRNIDGLLERCRRGSPTPTLNSNSMIALFSHVRTGRWATVMPDKLAEALGLTQQLRSVPIVEPDPPTRSACSCPSADLDRDRRRPRSRSERCRPNTLLNTINPPRRHR